MTALDSVILDILRGGPSTVRQIASVVNRDAVRPRPVTAIRTSLQRLRRQRLVGYRRRVRLPGLLWRLR